MGINELEREEIIREARSEMARQAVESRWARLDRVGRAKAVAPANEARRKKAAQRRKAKAAQKQRGEVIANLLAVME